MVHFVSLIFTLASTVIFFQNDALIEWNEFYEIQWSDFKGKPTSESIGDAGTAVQIKAQPYLVRKEINYNVSAFFNRNKSWYRDRSDALLNHERLHFDIAELYARKIRQRIEELNRKNVSDLKIYNAAIEDLLEESNRVDQQYDIETLHGAITNRQKVWEQRVSEELKSLEKYKKTKHIISNG